MSDETTRSRTGRKRSEESRQAILDAAFELLGEVGYGRMAVEGIASRAGSGKQTIYRWWPGKADVLLEALQAKADLYISIADQGSYEQELRTFLTDSARLGRRRPEITEALRALMAEAQVDRRFAERFDVFLWGRRAALTTIVERAAARGDLPARPAPATIAEIVFGVIWYRVLVLREAMDDALVDDLVAVLVPTGAGLP